MIEATATLMLEVALDCPACGEQLDLMQVDDLNDERQMFDLIQNEKKWENPELNFDCPACETRIFLSELKY